MPDIAVYTWNYILPHTDIHHTHLITTPCLIPHSLFVLHYITLYIACNTPPHAIPAITLHYITLHPVHCSAALHYVTLHSVQYSAVLHYTTLHYVTLRYTTLHYVTLRYTTLHYVTLHSVQYSAALHYITLHYTTLHYTQYSAVLHYITLHYTTLHCTQYSTVQCCTTLRYTTLHTFIFFLFQGVLKTPVTLTCGSDPCVGKFCSSDPDARCFTDFQCKASFWNLNVKEEIMECKGKVVHVHYLVLNTNENRQLGTY